MEARAKRVVLSSKIPTSSRDWNRRLGFSKTISATRICRCAGSSIVLPERCDNEAVLPLANWREEVDDIHGEIAISAFQLPALVRLNGGQIIAEHALPDHLWVVGVNGLDAQERKIFFIPL